MPIKAATVFWRERHNSTNSSKEERIKVEFDSKSFKFSTIDSWVRSRYGLPSDAKLQYSRKGLETGQSFHKSLWFSLYRLRESRRYLFLLLEFVPDSSWIDQEDPSVIISCIYRGSAIGSSSDSSIPKTEPSVNPLSFVAFPFCVLVVLCTLLGLYPHYLKYHGVSIVDTFYHIDTYLMNENFVAKRGCSLDAFIAMICWSTTNLFVRRLWNPETAATALQKYSADAFFGGLAAAAAVYLRYHLQLRLEF